MYPVPLLFFTVPLLPLESCYTKPSSLIIDYNKLFVKKKGRRRAPRV